MNETQEKDGDIDMLSTLFKQNNQIIKQIIKKQTND